MPPHPARHWQRTGGLRECLNRPPAGEVPEKDEIEPKAEI
jgi:hypothetical protein